MLSKIKIVLNNVDIDVPFIDRVLSKLSINHNKLITNIGHNSSGYLLLELDSSTNKIVDFFDKISVKNLDGDFISSSISIDDAKCVDCGACTSVCKTEALYFEKYDIKYINEKCISCNECLSACPTKAISVN